MEKILSIWQWTTDTAFWEQFLLQSSSCIPLFSIMMSAKKTFPKAKYVSSLLLKKEGKHVMIVDTHASFVQPCYMILLKQGQT